jgi:plastocyanin
MVAFFETKTYKYKQVLKLFMELKCPMAAIVLVLLFSSSVCGALISGEVKEAVQKRGDDVVTISFRNLRFYPAEVTISPGTTIVWFNDDRVPHKIAAHDRSFYGPRLQPGDKYAFTFVNEGTHTYFDAVFPKIGRGTIIVKEEPKPVVEDLVETGLREEERDKILGEAYKHPMIYLIFLQKDLLM